MRVNNIIHVFIVDFVSEADLSFVVPAQESNQMSADGE